MARLPLDPDEALAPALYLVALLLIGIPALDFVQSVGAPQLRNVQWRFASAGLLSGLLITPLLGVAMAIVVASVRGHAVTLRILSYLSIAGALAFLAVIAGFALDTLQLRSIVPEQRQLEFRSAAIKAALKYAATVVALGYLGFRGLRIRLEKSSTTARQGVPLVKNA